MAMKSPVACTERGCARLAKVGDGGLCDIHKKKRHDNYRKFRTDEKFSRVYSSKAWKLARRAALERDLGWCVRCKEKPAEVVDHIKELKDGGSPYDLENLQSLCNSCHAIKTREVAALR